MSYWAPDPTLASSPEAASREVQRLVAGLHAAGLAVLMQVRASRMGKETLLVRCAGAPWV